IPLDRLALTLVPVLVVIYILYRWSNEQRNAVYAILRMLTQLLLIGYFLTHIFESEYATTTLMVLCVMVFTSSWIALRTLQQRTFGLYMQALISMSVGGGIALIVVIVGVLDLQPWYYPKYFIPLAGMIFANAMNSVSLAADRLEAELDRDVAYPAARNIAFRASLIPITNSLFAVGLVSIPGMMTGQILSGVSPLIAARYQIMVMCMIYASAGISSACFLTLAAKRTSH
ncbi:MAG: ABC transporter permease, partial [Anaerolineales bacterium]|nr:ABC transporter permease [Anaerolineales bacterium]